MTICFSYGSISIMSFKRFFLSCLLVIFTLLFFSEKFLASSTTQTYATSAPTVSLSDAIYADLASRQALDNVSLFYTDGKGVNDVKINEDRHWLPASTVKLYVAMYVFKRIQDGAIHLNDTLTIDAVNEVPTELVTDQLPTLLTGDTVTVERLLTQMITQSDNTAYNQLLDLVGRDGVTSYVQSLGLTHTKIGSKLNQDTSQQQTEYDIPGYGINTTTASDYAKAYELIEKNKIAGAKELFAILKDQKINNMIPFYLPKDVICAHKTGDLAPIYHDGGICSDTKRKYILTIFTNFGDPNLLAHLSEIIYTRNYNLVGEDISKPTISTLPHALDPLVMNQVPPRVLGASTDTNYPTPDITAADLGISAKDLSLVIPDDKLPSVIIPVTSPFHILSDIAQGTQKLLAIGPAARRNVDLQTAQLRLAELHQLLSEKNISPATKTTETHALLDAIQHGIDTLSKDPTIAHDSLTQNTLQAVSQTRFSLLGNQVSTTTGENKLAWIAQTAHYAKQQISVEKDLPDSLNATNPDQKPLTGTIVAVTNTSYTLKTAGGTQITIPNDSSVSVKTTSLSSVITPTPQISPSVSPSLSETISSTITPPLQPSSTLSVGSTVAVLGTQHGNTFAASVIIPNVPTDLIAPVPVTVAKVNQKDNSMVVVENGVYTQVNINPNTTIKGADTNIPLKAIQAGDVVVVHGQPLVQSQPAAPTTSPTVVQHPTTPSTTPSTSTQPTLQPTSSTTVSPTISPSANPSFVPNSVGKIIAPTLQPITITAVPSGKNIPSPTIHSTNPVPTATQSVPIPSTQPKAGGPLVQTPSHTPTTPPVINSVSIQLIEKNTDVKNPAPQQHAPSTPQPQPQQQSHPQPAQQQSNQPPAAPSTNSSGKSTGKGK